MTAGKWTVPRWHRAKGAPRRLVHSVANRDRWIPVGERLPPKEKFVLVLCQQSGVNEVARRCNFTKDWKTRTGWTMAIVSHWQELPAGPGSEP